jgi:hypothetical protein
MLGLSGLTGRGGVVFKPAMAFVRDIRESLISARVDEWSSKVSGRGASVDFWIV